MNIQRACNYMVSIGYKLPYGLLPGSYPGGVNLEFTEEEWENYWWNPPRGYELPDPECSSKFSWRQLIWADVQAKRVQLPEQWSRELRAECHRRITQAYEADDAQDEIWKRLRGDNTPEQDTERDRLRAKCKALIAALPNLDLESLEAFDPTDDSHWVESQSD